MPTLADYQSFIQCVVGIGPQYLCPNSDVVTMTYNIALDMVNLDIANISSIIYDQCVYNLAADHLINFAQDNYGQTFFSDLRSTLKINSFAPGLISESHDEITGQTLLNPEVMKNLSLANLQNLKTPYGRTYLQYAATYGTLWGVS